MLIVKYYMAAQYMQTLNGYIIDLIVNKAQVRG